MILKGNIVDIENEQIFKGEIKVENGKIISITSKDNDSDDYILPGFIDAHIHIESSMLVPSEFARMAVVHGTVATVSDPHEIGNVLGIPGVQFMIDNGNKVPFKFNFGAPSCVPATSFESAGAVIDSNGIKTLLEQPEIKYLAEMMNYPGVIYDDGEVLKKIKWAKHFNKPVDGHAPGLRGEKLSKYIDAGISTDHESFTFEEGLEKLQKGMKILIREGSAAKNFNALIDLVPEWWNEMMFCSDDKHPDDLIVGHINQLVLRGLEKGISIFKLLKMACINPVKHYNLDVGLLKVGDPADFILVDNLDKLNIKQTFINGECVNDAGVSQIKAVSFEKPNNFNCARTSANDFKIAAEGNKIRVIEAMDGALITNELIADAKIVNGYYEADLESDLLKIIVVNRYKSAKPAIGFIKNIGLKKGAIASSVAHDSHNIIAVGTSDEMISKAVNKIIEQKGGISAVDENEALVLGLPIAGIMSDLDAITTGRAYEKIDAKAKQMGSSLHAPYMTISFMALLVIPALKLSDFGLFDGNSFQFTPLSLKN